MQNGCPVHTCFDCRDRSLDIMPLEPISLKNEFSHLTQKEKFHKYRGLWKKCQEFEILTDYPLHLDLELSGKCNFQCPDCFQNGLIKGKLGLMNANLFKKIIETGVENGLCAIKLQVRGESFLHPEILDLIRFAKTTGVLDVQITTNGSLLNKKKIDQLIESNIDAIIFSVDAHHAVNYQSAKNKNKEDLYYEKSRELINYLLEKRNEMNRQKPWIRIQSSVTGEDISKSGPVTTSLQENFPLADVHIVNRIHNFRDNEDAYPDLHTNYKLEKCAYLTQRLAVFWNGDITTCCSDYNNRFNLGNANKDEIQRVWLSKKMEHFRNKHLEGNRGNMPICRHCPACIYPMKTKLTNDRSHQHGADIP